MIGAITGTIIACSQYFWEHIYCAGKPDCLEYQTLQGYTAHTPHIHMYVGRTTHVSSSHHVCIRFILWCFVYTFAHIRTHLRHILNTYLICISFIFALCFVLPCRNRRGVWFCAVVGWGGRALAPPRVLNEYRRRNILAAHINVTHGKQNQLHPI